MTQRFKHNLRFLSTLLRYRSAWITVSSSRSWDITLSDKPATHLGRLAPTVKDVQCLRIAAVASRITPSPHHTRLLWIVSIPLKRTINTVQMVYSLVINSTLTFTTGSSLCHGTTSPPPKTPLTTNTRNKRTNSHTVQGQWYWYQVGEMIILLLRRVILTGSQQVGPVYFFNDLTWPVNRTFDLRNKLTYKIQ